MVHDRLRRYVLFSLSLSLREACVLRETRDTCMNHMGFLFILTGCEHEAHGRSSKMLNKPCQRDQGVPHPPFRTNQNTLDRLTFVFIFGVTTSETYEDRNSKSQKAVASTLPCGRGLLHRPIFFPLIFPVYSVVLLYLLPRRERERKRERGGRWSIRRVSI